MTEISEHCAIVKKIQYSILEYDWQPYSKAPRTAAVAGVQRGEACMHRQVHRTDNTLL